MRFVRSHSWLERRTPVAGTFVSRMYTLPKIFGFSNGCQKKTNFPGRAFIPETKLSTMGARCRNNLKTHTRTFSVLQPRGFSQTLNRKSPSLGAEPISWSRSQQKKSHKSKQPTNWAHHERNTTWFTGFKFWLKR